MPLEATPLMAMVLLLLGAVAAPRECGPESADELADIAGLASLG
ncbi:hypothetical protein EDC65_5158 [Stella humosa]|uniref:Uncharacterized protein n=1 Tax=Stella humosa TaxID=94 RepID=A0A3N1KPS2_9PROT|nr:hypothetical protein EDC65_5158 [Stella humosa]BBK32651.1 hypothetical protein STHU_32850 [Stella humosa]